jgi:hypothetical protein
MSQEIETIFSDLEENVVTKGAKPAEKSEFSNEAEEIGGSSNETPDGGPIGKKVAAKMKKATAPSTHPSQASGKLAEAKKEKEEKEKEEAGEPEEDSAADEAEDKKEEGKKKEKEMKEYFEVDLSDDVAALTEGEDLSEEFKSKAATIFEAAVVSRLNEQLEVIHEEYAQILEEEVAAVRTELAEQIDDYLSYAVSQWMEDNTLAIEHGIKTEIAENVMSGLQQVFAENYLSVPDEKVDLIDEMVDQLDVMENKLNEQIDRNIELNKKIGNYIKNGIVNEVSEDLAMSQKDKLQSLAEGLEFDTEESYRKKIEMLKESYFPSKHSTTVVEDTQVENAEITDAMSAYAAAINRWSR